MPRKLVVLCAALGFTLAEVLVGKLQPKPEKFKDVEGCYISELDQVIPFGASHSSAQECMECSCDKDWLSYAYCGIAVAVPPCELVEDEGKPYPDCCPRLNDSPACYAIPVSNTSDVI